MLHRASKPLRKRQVRALIENDHQAIAAQTIAAPAAASKAVVPADQRFLTPIEPAAAE
jgi:hypothetical protein